VLARRIAPSLLTTVLCALALLASACTSDGPDDPDNDARPTQTNPSPSQSPSTPPVAGSMDLDVLEYNIEYGGDASTDAVIRKLDADVVGVLESYNRLPEIARKTGYPYYDVGLQILSKYPILEPSGADGLYSFIEVKPGYVVPFFNTHLDYVAYGPRLVSQGMPIAQVIASEDEVRTSSMQILTPSMQRLIDDGYPVILTGDFNEPSSLDYSKATIGMRPGIDRPIPWPVSEELLGIGLHDVFRDAYPDPVANPGYTHDNPDFRKGGTGDRIDYVYVGGGVETVDAKLVGETGGPNVDIGFDKWTSDHRAVLATLSVQPVALPTTIALDRRMLTEGDKYTVYYNAPGLAEGSNLTVAVIPEGGSLSSAVSTETLDGASGMLTMDTEKLAPGGYLIAMISGGGELASNQFWVRSAHADVHVATDRPRYAVGQPIEVSWDDGPANRWDWIGVYRAEADNPHTDDYLLWGYTGGHESGALPPSISGSMTLDGSSQGAPWPLPPGRYVVHYLLTDQYNSAGSAAFTVVG
jgi:endonuclease/exonuclease/phosphatase family metal-dependent hydrolase